LSARAALLAAVAVVVQVPAAAGQDSAWYGTWQLDVERSEYRPGPAPYRRGTLVIEPWDGGVRMVYDLVGVRGGVTHLEWTGRFDGRDYPVQGADEYITYAYVVVDERTWRAAVKVDGRVVATATVTLSADGRTMTTETRGTDYRGRPLLTTTVYRKKSNQI
jgi:hypothetical protein